MNDPTAYVDPFDEMNRAARRTTPIGNPSMLTKREYFAGLALSGMLGDNRTFKFDQDVLTQTAVNLADALINALEKNA